MKPQPKKHPKSHKTAKSYKSVSTLKSLKTNRKTLKPPKVIKKILKAIKPLKTPKPTKPHQQTVLVIDNYDSFTYNLVQYLGQLGAKVTVLRPTGIDFAQIEKKPPDRIVISPGPGEPANFPQTCEIVRRFAGKIPILGVCLGHQTIGYVFGAKIIRAKDLVHGKTSNIYHWGRGLYRGLPNPFTATRYHSLLVDEATLPKSFQVTARSEKKELMGIKHKKYALEGVQYHPESILTSEGLKLLKNFLSQ